MKVIKARPGTEIPNPADPLGPPLAVVATAARGKLSIVMRGPHDSVEEMRAKAKLIYNLRRFNGQKARERKSRLDRKEPPRKNSSG